ncbi:hypothetical protein R1sor_004784 [Riccia sorocarpa]|uniref:Uncharacterized protein n=1 Tax=Riccia sorocarpa TaxID=122646 RepID=A0ABD3HI86_9MARC
MPKFFLNFNILPNDSQFKGWSNRPQVPIESRWWKKGGSSSPSPPSTPKPTRTPPTASPPRSTKESRNVGRSSPPAGYAQSPPPSTRPKSKGSSGKGSTRNLLFINPIFRSCTDVVNSITHPLRRRPPKRTSSKTFTGPNGRSSRSKPTWNGLPSDQYLRLSPEPDYERLREVKNRSERPTNLSQVSYNTSYTGEQDSDSKPEKQKGRKTPKARREALAEKATVVISISQSKKPSLLKIPEGQFAYHLNRWLNQEEVRA